jgi:hypothetical protein
LSIPIRTSIVNQREVGVDTKSFGSALKRVLRQDPDFILVGELRDAETIEMALTMAETGHLFLVPSIRTERFNPLIVSSTFFHLISNLRCGKCFLSRWLGFCHSN